MIRKLERPSPVGVVGVLLACFGLYLVVFPAWLLMLLADGNFHDPAMQAIAAAFILAALTVVAAVLVAAAALIRMAYLGAWPGRRFVLGSPAAAVGGATCALTALVALLL